MLVAEPAFGPGVTDGLTLRVRYCATSPSFNHFIRHGTLLPRSSLLTTVAITSITNVGIVRGDALGMRSDRRFLVECRCWGPAGEILALLKEQWEGKQLRLDLATLPL